MGNKSSDKKQPMLPEKMRYSVEPDSMQAWIAKDNLQ